MAATHVMKFVATETPFVLRSSRRMRAPMPPHPADGRATGTSAPRAFAPQATSFVTAVLSGNVAMSRFVSIRAKSFVRVNGT